MALAATMSPENSLADQSCTGRNEIMTLRFAEIQQELKVAAAECRAAYDYKRFVHAYKPALDLSDQAMLSVFRDNSVGDTGTSAYAAFKAQLVSNSLLRSARNKAAFCAEARSEFSSAFSGEGALETLISSSQPYVDLPFKDCSQSPEPPFSAAVVAQQAASPSVASQQVQVAQATVPPVPLAPLALRPDPPEIARVVPHHAPLVPAMPQMMRPAGVATTAPQFDIAAPPAPQPPPIMFARVVPQHAPFVPSAPAMTAPAVQIAQAPRFAITPDFDPVVLAHVVPHHARFVPAVPAMTAPPTQAVPAPRFAIARETQPVVVARVEEPFVIRHVVPRRSALRPAGLVLFHPRAAAIAAPDVEVARAIPRAAPSPAPVRREASDSAVTRGLARLSAIAAAMLKRDAAADAAEPPPHARPMVAAVAPAPRPADSAPTDDNMELAAAQAADILRSERDPHPERRMAARQPLNQGTTHRRLAAVTAKPTPSPTPVKPAVVVAHADQTIVVPTRAVHAPIQVPSSEAMDQSAVVVTGRADTSTPKLAHGFVSAKATTYGRAPKPVGGDVNTDDANAPPAPPATAPDAPSAALMPQDQGQDQNSNPDQDNDQQSAPNGNQDDQYGPAYAYDDGYARARARARAWRRRIIDAYETYRRRSVPEDYGGDYPPPPPWRNESGEDTWSNAN